MNIKLLSDRILIEADDKEQKRDSGLILSKNPEPGDLQSGTVVATGEGRLEEGAIVPTGVSKGDKVMFQYGSKVDVDGKTLTLVRADDIIMVIS